jgi:hypothetical protein
MNYLFLILFAIVFITWVVAFAAFHVVGGLIHILLLLAVVFLIAHFVGGHKAV